MDGIGVRTSHSLKIKNGNEDMGNLLIIQRTKT